MLVIRLAWSMLGSLLFSGTSCFSWLGSGSIGVLAVTLNLWFTPADNSADSLPLAAKKSSEKSQTDFKHGKDNGGQVGQYFVDLSAMETGSQFCSHNSTTGTLISGLETRAVKVICIHLCHENI